VLQIRSNNFYHSPLVWLTIGFDLQLLIPFYMNAAYLVLVFYSEM